MKAGLWRSATGSGRKQTGQSIRGKISNPIPITNAGDEDFHTQNPGPITLKTHNPDDGNPVSQHSSRPPRHHHHATASSSTLPHTALPPASNNTPDIEDNKNSGSNNSLPMSAAPAGRSGPSPASGSARDSPRRRTDPSSHIRYSVISASSQRSGDTGNKNLPQRKKSTIRGALSKLFGRKKKGKSQGSSVPEHSSGTNSVQHRSDLSTLTRAAQDVEPKRSASLPITEYDRALRSHSVGPGDITAIESARNSLHTDYNFTRRRAATTSTHFLPFGRVKDDELAGLSPRPASTHARGSRILDDDPNVIGRAITSDLGGLRRRSRSLSGLDGISGGRNGSLRRRSDEIRYWRESYGPGVASPLSSNVPEADDVGSGAVDSPANAASTERRSSSPPDPFNFESVATMNAMADIKITQAANLEDRLGALEARMRRIEILVSRLRDAVPEPAESPVFGRAPPPARPVPTASDATLAYASSAAPTGPLSYRTGSRDGGASGVYTHSRPSEDTQSSFDEASTFTGALRPPPGAHSRRPNSNSTIRGAASLPALSREANGPFTTDHYATVLALLETERSTRRTLEAQVQKLSRTVDALTRQQGTGTMLNPPPTARSFGGQSAFDDDTTDDGGSENDTPRRRSAKVEDSGIAPGLEDTEDENPSETFATPREERTLRFGAFGEVLREDEDDGNRKKAARTLSLSQLTVAKGQQQF